MDVFEAIANRRSMRTYTDAPVSREKLMQVLEAARLAPSWKNDQGWRFLVLDNRADILALGQALGEAGFALRAGYHCAPYAHQTAGTIETGTLRFSASAFNTGQEAEELARYLRGR